MERHYNPHDIEPRWQQRWEADRAFAATEDPTRPKYYCLEMLPYPSGRIHMGHVRNYTIGDALARYKWMRGFNVLHPMGWDAFGMPAENAAIQRQVHPAAWTRENIAHMRAQLRKMGFAYDWSREVSTCEPDYYRWEQWVFLKLYARGLAFRKRSAVNWCERCQTVLANEQAEGGICWRCDGPVALRSMEQWFLRFPEYAEVLLDDLAGLAAWPERVRAMQREWIGRSEGAFIQFPLEGRESEAVEVFTTRPDTLFGVTFLTLAWEHPLVTALTRGTPYEQDVARFVRAAAAVSREDRLAERFEKHGVFTGAYASHPLTRERLPIYAANFVVMEYGTGAVMGVPAHDQRDYEFAAKYRLPVRVVIEPHDPTLRAAAGAYEGPGRMTHSPGFDGQDNTAAMRGLTDRLAREGKGRAAVTYKLKDWCISRQRYWGTPIPVMHCGVCGIVPVPESDLPVVLPHDVPLTGEGGSPLAKAPDFVQAPCPSCGRPARRETDTMDTFMESSWYFLRYCSPHYRDGMVDPQAARYWMPIDYYIGGIEHAVGHLLYCRFYMKLLRDLGVCDYSPTNEPAAALLTQGMVIKDGAKMSKSKGNVVDPDEIIARYGADTARLFILFAAPPEKDLEWNDRAVEGMYRFLGRVWRAVAACVAGGADNDPDATVFRLMHKTIRRVTDDIERLHFNTALAAIMEYVNTLQGAAPSRVAGETLALLLAPFAPHIAEELWAALGHSGGIRRVPWPQADPRYLAEATCCIVVQVNGKLRDRITVDADATPEAVKAAALTEKARAHIGGKPVANVIYVPGRLVNIVTD
ncbi:MAG: leucine--tRNA ligase [Deltaproteobacteria bacterium]|nr:leucine--tRNA ligase [Deltaproteobacteria bacterium]